MLCGNGLVAKVKKCYKFRSLMLRVMVVNLSLFATVAMASNAVPVMNTALLLAACSSALQSKLLQLSPGQVRLVSGLLVVDQEGRQNLIMGSYLSGHYPLLLSLGPKHNEQYRILWGGEIKFIGTSQGPLAVTANETSGQLKKRGIRSDVSELQKFLKRLPATSIIQIATNFEPQIFNEANSHLVDLPRIDETSDNQRHALQNFASLFLSLAEFLRDSPGDGIANIRSTVSPVMDSLREAYRGLQAYLPFYSDSQYLVRPFTKEQEAQARSDLELFMSAIEGKDVAPAELTLTGARVESWMEMINAPIADILTVGEQSP